MRKAAETSTATVDERFMREALREASRGLKEDEVPAGAIVVCDDRIIARAHNRPIHLDDPGAHAEMLALRRAGRKLGNYRLPGCTLYATIEPCAMCAGALAHARIKRLVIGALDPKAGACGSSLTVLNHSKLNHRIEVQTGVLEADCARLMREFFQARRKKIDSLGH